MSAPSIEARGLPATTGGAPAFEPPRPSGPVMDGLPPSAARPLSFLRNGGAGGAPHSEPAGGPPPPAFPRNGGGANTSVPGGPHPPVTDAHASPTAARMTGGALPPSGPVMDGLPPSAARPLSFLRNGGAGQPPVPGAPPPSRGGPAPMPPAGATSLSRTTEPAPTVRVTNVRRPEPSGPPEPPPYDDEDARLFAEEGSAEGCASGDCLPAAPEPEAPEPEPEPAPPPARLGHGRDNPNLSLPERWRAAVESVKAASPRHGAALANGRLVSMRAGEIVLGFLPQAGFHRNAVTSPAGKATVDNALAEHFGRQVKLTIQDISPDSAGVAPSIAEQDAQSRAAHEKSTEGKVRSHPGVRAVLKLLGGEIEHIQVYEPERAPAAPSADVPPPEDSA